MRLTHSSSSTQASQLLAGRPKVGDGTIVVELTYENEKYMLRIVTKARCLTQMCTAKAGEDLISIRKPESI